MPTIRKTLDDRDWDKDFKGWHCPELKNHSLAEVRVDGAGRHLDDFQARGDVGIITWRGSGSKPTSIVVVLAPSKTEESKAAASPVLTAVITAVLGIFAASTAPWWASSLPSCQGGGSATASASTGTTSSSSPPPHSKCGVGVPEGATCDEEGYIIRFSTSVSRSSFPRDKRTTILDLSGFRRGAKLAVELKLQATHQRNSRTRQAFEWGLLGKAQPLGDKAFRKGLGSSPDCTETSCSFDGRLVDTTPNGSLSVDLAMLRCENLSGFMDCNIQGQITVVEETSHSADHDG